MKRWVVPALVGLCLVGVVWGQPLLQNPDIQQHNLVPVKVEEASPKVTWQFFVQNGSAATDVCGVLTEARRQQAMVMFAYQNLEVLKAAEDSGLDWQGYSQAVENLVRRIYTVGSIEGFDFGRDVGQIEVLFKPVPTSFDPGEVQIITVLETHSNGTVWGFDQRGNRVLLVDRSGMIHETSQELVIQAHKIHFGELAGELLYYAHLNHELQHRLQLVRHSEGYVPGLEEYQRNEIEAYQRSIQTKDQALKANGCF